MDAMPHSKGAKWKRFSTNSSAVSEIIGDILLVSIAVVMVGALAIQMGTVTPPADRSMASLGTFYDGNNVTVTHLGGDALDNISTRFYLYSNDTLTRSLNVSDGRPGAAKLVIGDNWTVSFPSNLTQRIRLQIIDTRGQLVMLDRLLQRGPDVGIFPDLAIGPNDIALMRNFLPIDEVSNAPMTNETIMINCTIRNFGGSGVPGVQVRITDYSILDLHTYIVANRTIPWLGPLGAINISVNYRIENGSWGLHTVNVKIIPVYNETRYANNYASKNYRVGYPVMASSPTRPYLFIRSIEFSNEHPVHGSTIMVTARISNQGGVPSYATVRYYDNAKTSLIGTDAGLGIPVGGESISTLFWKTTSGGVHTVIVNVTDPNGTGDEKSRQLEILPTILLVDDDRATDGSTRDVVSQMQAALQSVGATYTVHTVAGGDGPMYDGGDHPLRDYDLVIWMTGFENSNTLTANDQINLYKYLFNSHERLWLIGQDVVTDLGYGSVFLHKLFGLDPATPPAWMDVGTPNPIEGVKILNSTDFCATDPFPAGLTDKGDLLKNVSTKASVALMENSAPYRPVGLLLNATTNGSAAATTHTASLFSFELSKLKSPNDRSLIVYSMLEWFNCSARWGRDLAISDQQFNITAPTFMENVNITVFVRNNGLANEPPDFISPILEVGFYVDNKTFDPVSVTIDDGTTITTFDGTSSEVWIPPPSSPGMFIPGRGGFIKVSMVWTADKVGEHNITVTVDPYDYIEEINEYNNRVASAVNDGRIFVRYGTLLVDDDQSANNGGANYNATYNMSTALTSLSYSHDVYVVSGAATDGPSLDKLDQYNAIIWMAGATANSLTAIDKANLEAFLNKTDGRYLWLVGQDAVPAGNYSDGSDPFYRDFLRVARSVDPGAPKTPARMAGVNQDVLTHGMLSPVQPTFTDSGGLLVPYMDGRGIFYQSPMPDVNSFNKIAYCDAQDGTIEGWYVWNPPALPPTTNTVSNVFDDVLESRVISVNRTGVNVQDSVFLLGDYSSTDNQNPLDAPFAERDRLTAQWSFNFPMDYTFGWHVTDNSSNRHELFYNSSDADVGGANPRFGLGSWTADGSWHTVTRDLLRDLRNGTGNPTLNISTVDGFEVRINAGEGRVDDILLTRPFNSIRYENITANFKTVFTAWDFSFISYTGNNNYRSELAYMVMSWFNLYDERTELRITYQDLYYSNMTMVRDMKPMMGESYVLKAMVWNPGGTRGDAVVRFMDGATVIDSVTLSVESGSRALAEIVWRPLFAGSRTIGAYVDPDSMVAEVMKFNNYAGVTVQCYFFYDDLESGARNFKHDATLLRIGGESPLEYLDPGTVQTSIVKDWDQLSGITYNGTDYHSYNSSYRFIAPGVQDYTYTFFMSFDPWWNHDTSDGTWHQGFYVVAIQKDAFYTVQRFNTATLNWDVFNTNTLTKGSVYLYANQAPNTLYRIHSFGPLLVVVTSSEGSNVNVANVDDGLATGRNFSVMGDLGYRLGNVVHVAAIAMDANVDVSVKWYNYNLASNTVGAQLGATQNFNLALKEYRHEFWAPAHAGYVLAVVNSTKPIMLYRLSNDNDELDNAMASTGYTYGKELYFCMYQNIWTWRFIISNIDDVAASNVNIYASTAGNGWGGWQWPGDKTIPAHTSKMFSPGTPYGSGTIYFKVTADRNVTVVFGQEQGSPPAFDNNCPEYQWRFGVDGVWDYRAVRDTPGNFVMMSPQVYSSQSWTGNHYLETTFQDFSFGTAIDININPGLPVLGSANGVTNSGMKYISSVPFTLMVTRTGTLNNNEWELEDIGIWNGYSFDASGNANITVPAGEHVVRFKTVFGVSGALKVIRMSTEAGGEIAWQLYPNIGDDPATGWNEATSQCDQGHWWTYTANHRFLYLVGGSGNCWIHTILPFEGAVEIPGIMRGGTDGQQAAGNDGQQGAGSRQQESDGQQAGGSRQQGTTGAEGAASGRANDNFWAITQNFSLVGYSSAELSFYQKYALQVGANGVVIMVGNDTAGNNIYKYRYVTPKRPYTGNIRFDVFPSQIMDDFSREMRWCFNGISTNGLGLWDYITVDLTPFIGQQHVKIKFLYINATMTSVGFWYVDDIVVKASRADATAVTTGVLDQWELVKRGDPVGGGGGDLADSYNGKRAWLCHDANAAGVDYLKGGLDNSLTTVPIDLTNALDAALDVKFKFNINNSDGRPPDGFRVEVSSDNGETWQALNRGVRSGSGVSGTLAAGADGTSTTGVNLTEYWVSGQTMSRLNCDLSGWAGTVILLRFRVVTRTDIANHYESNTKGFGGIYIDDVRVVGNTTTGGRAAGSRQLGDDEAAGSRQPAEGTDGTEAAGSRQQAAGTDERVPVPNMVDVTRNWNQALAVPRQFKHEPTSGGDAR
jgi:hypothetical protein